MPGLSDPRTSAISSEARWADPLIKDRVWFFVSYQGSRERNGTSLLNSIGTVFVPENLSNDRSDAAIDALAGTFGVPAVCPGVTGCLDPTAKFLLQAKLPNGAYVIPSATNRQCVRTFRFRVPPVVALSRFREDQFNTNLDFQLSGEEPVVGEILWREQSCDAGPI